MKRAFGDTHYFLALLNPRDQDHERATEFGEQWRGKIVTTRWILAELADAFSEPPLRAVAVAFFLRLEANPHLRVLPADDRQFMRGFELYRRRPDKEWSLTDCISFVVMSDEGLTDALTTDGHFRQAGFVPLLAP
jgi:predicted nucleic acid-binding protein